MNNISLDFTSLVPKKLETDKNSCRIPELSFVAEKKFRKGSNYKMTTEPQPYFSITYPVPCTIAFMLFH